MCDSLSRRLLRKYNQSVMPTMQYYNMQDMSILPKQLHILLCSLHLQPTDPNLPPLLPDLHLRRPILPIMPCLQISLHILHNIVVYILLN